jgi:hypothetical protein
MTYSGFGLVDTAVAARVVAAVHSLELLAVIDFVGTDADFRSPQAE